MDCSTAQHIMVRSGASIHCVQKLCLEVAFCAILYVCRHFPVSAVTWDSPSAVLRGLRRCSLGESRGEQCERPVRSSLVTLPFCQRVVQAVQSSIKICVWACMSWLVAAGRRFFVASCISPIPTPLQPLVRPTALPHAAWLFSCRLISLAASCRLCVSSTRIAPDLLAMHNLFGISPIDKCLRSRVCQVVVHVELVIQPLRQLNGSSEFRAARLRLRQVWKFSPPAANEAAFVLCVRTVHAVLSAPLRHTRLCA